CFLRGIASPRPGRWYVGAIAACALGMGCKETMVAAPLLVLLYDRTFVANFFRDALQRRRGLYVALAATWAILIALLIVSPRTAMVGRALGSLGWLGYLRIQVSAIPYYLFATLW